MATIQWEIQRAPSSRRAATSDAQEAIGTGHCGKGGSDRSGSTRSRRVDGVDIRRVGSLVSGSTVGRSGPGIASESRSGRRQPCSLQPASPRPCSIPAAPSCRHDASLHADAPMIRTAMAPRFAENDRRNRATRDRDVRRCRDAASNRNHRAPRSGHSRQGTPCPPKSRGRRPADQIRIAAPQLDHNRLKQRSNNQVIRTFPQSPHPARSP